MTTQIGRYAVLAAIVLPLLAQAQAGGLPVAQRRALVSSLPQGAEFRSGGQTYRPVGGLRATLRGPAEVVQGAQAAAPATGEVVEILGPFAIHRALAAEAPASAATTGVGATTSRAVVVNVRTGSLGIATGIVTAKLVDAGTARAIAAANGVTLRHASEGTGYAFFGVPEGRDLVEVAAAIARSPGVEMAEVNVKEDFDSPN